MEIRIGALVAVEAIAKNKHREVEPFLLPLLPLVLECAAEKKTAAAAESASRAILAALNPLATKILLPILFDGMSLKKKWQSKVLALQLLGDLPKTATSEVRGRVVGGAARGRPASAACTCYIAVVTPPLLRC